MPKSQLFNAGTFTQANGTVRYIPFPCSSNALHTATELSCAYVNQDETFTVSNWQCRVITNTRTIGTAELRFRKNTADATGVCYIPFGTTGLFHDSTGSDIVGPLDTLAVKTTYGTGGGTGSIEFAGYNCVIDTTGANTLTRFNNYYSNNLGPGTLYAPLVDDSLSMTSTEAAVQTKLSAGKIRNLYAYSNANTRDGDSTITLRNNGVDTGITVTIPANTTGLFEDTTHEYTLIDTDIVSWKAVRGGTTGSVNLSILGCDFISTNNSFFSVLAGLSTFSPGSATDYFLQIGGETVETHTDAQTKNKVYLDNFSADIIRLNVASNTIASTSNFTLRKNGADTALTIAIPASTTGTFEDVAHTAAYVNGDDINYKLAAGGSGTISINSATMRMRYILNTYNKTRGFFKALGNF